MKKSEKKAENKISQKNAALNKKQKLEDQDSLMDV